MKSQFRREQAKENQSLAGGDRKSEENIKIALANQLANAIIKQTMKNKPPKLWQSQPESAAKRTASLSRCRRKRLKKLSKRFLAATQVGVVGEAKERLVAQGQELAEAVTDAECKMGELLREIPKASGGDRKSEEIKSNQRVIFDVPKKADAISDMGLTRNQVSQYQRMAEHREIVEQAKEAAREEGRILSRNDIVKRIQADKKEPFLCRKAKSSKTGRKVTVKKGVAELTHPTVAAGHWTFRHFAR